MPSILEKTAALAPRRPATALLAMAGGLLLLGAGSNAAMAATACGEQSEVCKDPLQGPLTSPITYFDYGIFMKKALSTSVGTLQIANQKIAGTRSLIYPKSTHGFPIFPPECYDGGKDVPGGPPKDVDYCLLDFDPSTYHCPAGQTLFWRQSWVTEFSSNENGDQNRGALTGERLHALGKGQAGFASVSSDARLSQTDVKEARRHGKNVAKEDLAQVFIPAAGPKLGTDGNQLRMRVEDTGAGSLFDTKKDPILGYPLQAGKRWAIPKSDWPSRNKRAAFHFDVRTVGGHALNINDANQWAGVCVSDEKLKKAEASEAGR